MEKITSVRELKLAIANLEADRALKYNLLKSQVTITVESLKPSNMIKDSLSHAFNSGHVTENLIDGLIGLVAGFVSKKILIGGNGNLIKNTFGNIIQMVVAGLVSNNTEGIKSKGMDLLKMLFADKHK